MSVRFASDDEVIATRKLLLTINDGNVSEIEVGIKKPYPEISRVGVEHWLCKVYTTDPRLPISITFFGIDTLDAIEQAIIFLNRELDEIKEHYMDKVSWVLSADFPNGGPLRSTGCIGEQSWQVSEDTFWNSGNDQGATKTESSN